MNIKLSFEYDLKITDLVGNIVERDNVKFLNPVSVGDIVNEYNCQYKVTSIEHFINLKSTVLSCHVVNI